MARTYTCGPCDVPGAVALVVEVVEVVVVSVGVGCRFRRGGGSRQCGRVVLPLGAISGKGFAVVWPRRAGFFPALGGLWAGCLAAGVKCRCLL